MLDRLPVGLQCRLSIAAVVQRPTETAVRPGQVRIERNRAPPNGDGGAEQAAIADLPVAHGERHGQHGMGIRIGGIEFESLPQQAT